MSGASRSWSGDAIRCDAIPFGNHYVMSSPALVDYVRFLCDTSDGDHLDLQFSSGQASPSDLENWNHPLMIGFYERAMQAPVQIFPHPGISARSRDLGVETPSGRFVVLAADYDYSSGDVTVTRFAAAFQYVTDYHPVDPVTGLLFYNFEPTNSVTLSQSDVVGPASLAVTVRLTNPAPPGGAMIDLSSSQPDLVTLPGSIRIPAGSTEADVPIAVGAASEDDSVDILSVYGGAGSLATLRVTPLRPATTMIELHGDPGSPLVQGSLATGSEGSYLFRTSANEQVMTLRYAEGDAYWNFTFAAGANSRLGQGLFSAPGGLLDQGQTRLEIETGDSATAITCNLNAGWFAVHDLVFDESTNPLQVKRLWLTFEHTCNANSNARVRGSILYNEPASLRTRPGPH